MYIAMQKSGIRSYRNATKWNKVVVYIAMQQSENKVPCIWQCSRVEITSHVYSNAAKWNKVLVYIAIHLTGNKVPCIWQSSKVE